MNLVTNEGGATTLASACTQAQRVARHGNREGMSAECMGVACINPGARSSADCRGNLVAQEVDAQAAVCLVYPRVYTVRTAGVVLSHMAGGPIRGCHTREGAP